MDGHRSHISIFLLKKVITKRRIILDMQFPNQPLGVKWKVVKVVHCPTLWMDKDWCLYLYPTRSLRSQNSGLLVVPRIAKSTKGGRTFSYLAPKLWNSLPDYVRGSDTLSLFKSRLKTHLFSQAFI